jgi:BirA family biotin operon repressor/biotin-[acetyl-CoA-carboxylase] ligase
MAISIISALKEHTGYEFNVKWPNDIYFCDKKVGGILSETAVMPDNLNYINIGVGININNSFTTLDRFKNETASAHRVNYEFASLRTLFKKGFEREKILGDILNNFEKNYKYYIQKNDLDTIIKKINHKFIF